MVSGGSIHAISSPFCAVSGADAAPQDGTNLAQNNVVFPITFLDLSLVLVIPTPKGSSRFCARCFPMCQVLLHHMQKPALTSGVPLTASRRQLSPSFRPSTSTSGSHASQAKPAT
eukprot:3934318-Rhodomonas_salina.2